LNETLAFASPEDLREKDIIKVRILISMSRGKGLMIHLGMAYEVPHLSRPDCSANTMGDSRSGSIAYCS